jgi:hypothetical protein
VSDSFYLVATNSIWRSTFGETWTQIFTLTTDPASNTNGLASDGSSLLVNTSSQGVRNMSVPFSGPFLLMHSKAVTLGWLSVVALGVLGTLWWTSRIREELAAANRALAVAERRAAAAEAKVQQAEPAATAQKPSPLPAPALRADGTSPTPMFEAPVSWNKMQRSPGFVRIQAEEMRAGLFKNHGPVFKKLRLSPEDFRRLQDLMIERNMAGFEIANAQGDVTGTRLSTAQMQKLITDQQAAIDQETARLLGTEKWELFQNYNRTLDWRHEVNDIALRLDIAGTPLSEAQVDQLTDSLAAVETKLRAAHKNSLPSSIPLEAKRASDAEFVAALQEKVDAAQLATVTEYFEQKRSLEEEKRRMGETLARLRTESAPASKP